MTNTFTGIKNSSCSETQAHENLVVAIEASRKTPKHPNLKKMEKNIIRSDFLIDIHMTAAPITNSKHSKSDLIYLQSRPELTDIRDIFDILFLCPGYLNQGHIRK